MTKKKKKKKNNRVICFIILYYIHKKMNIILVHIGTILPEYLIDNIFQLLCIGTPNIYVVISDSLISELKLQLPNQKDNVHIIPESEDTNQDVSLYMEHFSREYRDHFWNSTTTRFYYIAKCINKYLPLEKNIVHIESDVLLYNLDFIPKLEQLKEHEIYMVKDHTYRVIPSIVIYKDAHAANDLAKHITDFLFSKKEEEDKREKEEEGEEEGDRKWYNDMYILSQYPYIKLLPHTIESSENGIIFDGASIGQYVCGVDPRNIKLDDYDKLDDNSKKLLNDIVTYDNPKIGFINETFRIMETCTIKDNILTDKNTGKSASIMNLHIHSKQLWSINSTNTIKHRDIITGDRILEQCDVVFTTPQTTAFHKDLKSYKSICLCLPFHFKNEHKVQIENALIDINSKKNEDRPLKVFVYSNYIRPISELLSRLDINFMMDLYIHNSDDHIEKDTIDTLDNTKYIRNVYCQNLTIVSKKSHILPIGLANRMYPHGSVIDIIQVIQNSYRNEKTKSLYIQMSNTHKIRQELMVHIKKNEGYILQESKPYREYLEELSKHYFALCPRGNGVDTHRFWESLYLGVIPVVIKESETDVFYESLKNKVPFVSISIEELNPSIFTKELYKKFGPIQILESLKMLSYI
jgi:DNA-dependent RNA polymerase auxiliary subunit epsilon